MIYDGLTGLIFYLNIDKIKNKNYIKINNNN